MKKRIFITFCCVFVVLCSSVAQDTVHTLNKVQVVGRRSDAFESGMKKQIISDENSAKSTSISLSELLLQSSPLLVKSSGAGSTSSISLRGAGASRSQISWEGFPINSLTAGVNDISLVPAQGFNYIAINHGAAATQFGSGSFGGAIELQNRPQWDNRFMAQASAGIGSFETYKTQAGVALGNERVQYNSSFFYNQAANNFTYFDTIAQKECERKNADFYGYGTIHNIHVRPTKKTTLHGSLWYQVKDMNLPAIAGNNSNYAENQVDSSLKAMVHFRSYFNKSVLSVRAAYVYDYLRYTKKVAPQAEKYMTYSVIEANRFLQSAQFRHFTTDELTLDAELQSNYSKAEVLSYYAPKSEYSLAGIVSAQYTKRNFQGAASLRKEYNTQYEIPFIFNIGAQQKMWDNKLLLRANFGSKYRTPTFNDLYWEGWGNPDLKPEHGYSVEGGVVVDWLKTNKNVLSSDVTAFFSSINNMIMWVPVGAVWNPLNIAQAQLRGVELQVNYIRKWTSWEWNNRASCNYNFSIISKINDGDDSQMLNHALYYVPKISLNYSPSLSYKRFETGAMLNMQSARYFVLTQQLAAFVLFDAFAAYTHSWEKINLTSSVLCKNIGNTAYELTRSFPMPGRYWEFNLKFTFNN
ncbi:MAG: TonB-dependent receptor plug domain-containing protein [Bacteroidetes bacterium]|nr:TonB-dependent receptor plug domain-containing protein [Bacteroidota bacterium]